MNLPSVHNGETGGNAGAVAFGGPQAAPAQFTVGQVGFGPCWEDEEIYLTDKGWKAITDSMAASIIRLEQEKQELVAEVALAEAERMEMAKMLRSEREMHAACQNERDALAEALRKRSTQ
jgi:DNA gyrase/topoisomerase IV subunit A